uniref:G_PROTEIN_RECEP_F1_2 domain-containing protein n=1 Tax=Macrostomum lignano TaxID=282301 RepID=A0A1I8FT68_9PLAT
MADYWTLASNSSSLATVSPTSFPTADWDTHGRVVPLTVLLVLLIFIIVFGNSLVVLAVFYERRLRLPSNYYVVSLAVADLAIGIAVVPISAVYEIATRWLLGQALCRMWISADITCCTASIINLCAISFDRYRALSQPMLYPQYSTAKRSCITITGIWAASLAISTPTLFGVGIEKRQSNQCLLAKRSAFVVFSACGSFFIPLCIMLVLYRLIFKIANKQRRKIQRGDSIAIASSSHAAALAQQRRQSGRRPKLLAKNPVAQRLRRLGSHTKAAKTLGIVVGAFVFAGVRSSSLTCCTASVTPVECRTP